MDGIILAHGELLRYSRNVYGRRRFANVNGGGHQAVTISSLSGRYAVHAEYCHPWYCAYYRLMCLLYLSARNNLLHHTKHLRMGGTVLCAVPQMSG